MRLSDFQKLRTGLHANAAPVLPGVKQAFLSGLTKALLATGVFEGVEVGSSDEPDRLLLALCTFREEVPDDEVVRAVEEAWLTVAFRHWSAHAFLTEDGHVELQAASLNRPGGYFVSAHVVAQRVVAPAAQLIETASAVVV